jgi:hypothetical protein
MFSALRSNCRDRFPHLLGAIWCARKNTAVAVCSGDRCRVILNDFGGHFQQNPSHLGKRYGAFLVLIYPPEDQLGSLAARTTSGDILILVSSRGSLKSRSSMHNITGIESDDMVLFTKELTLLLLPPGRFQLLILSLAPPRE